MEKARSSTTVRRGRYGQAVTRWRRSPSRTCRRTRYPILLVAAAVTADLAERIDLELPWRVGVGPVEFSTCVALAPSPGWCADAEGYYRALGVDWRASRVQLAQAYVALGGEGSARLTYVLAQLLDRDLRRRYDQVPLGKRFLRDEAVLDQVWANLVRRAGGDDGILRKLAGRVGLEAVTPEELDSGSLEAQDEQAPPERSFPYGYYLWRAQLPQPGLLARWRDLLVQAASRDGIVARVAVGVMGRTDHLTVHARVGYVDVLFIHQDIEPTELLAQTAIRLLRPADSP